MSSVQPTQGFIETMTRALTDATFRQELLQDPDAALGTAGLAPSDREFITKMVRENPDALSSAAENRIGHITATWGVFLVLKCLEKK